MKRTWLCGFTLIVVAMCCPMAAAQATSADNSGAGAFAAVPAEAWGVLRVRSIGEFDKQVGALAQRFGMPLPAGGPITMAKGFLGLVSGVNDAGDLVLVAMPAPSLPAIKQSLVLLVPTTDYGELTSLMDLQPLDGGVSKTAVETMFGPQELIIGPKGKYAVVGWTPEAVSAVVAAKGGLTGTLTPHQLKRSDEDNITVWLNADAVVTSPAVAPMLGMLQMSGIDTTELASLKSLQIGVQMSPTGIRLGVNTEAKAGTELARVTESVHDTNQSLLTGLIKEDYVLAVGMLMTEPGCERIAQSLNRMLSVPQMAAAPIDPQKLGELKELLVTMIRPTRSASAVFSAMPPGFDGMIGYTKVVTVEGDPAAMLKNMSELIALIKGGLITDEQANKMLGHLEYKHAAETVNGIAVDHLRFDLESIEDIQAEDLATVKKIVGNDGLLIRVGAVDAKHIVSTFGGGTAWFASAAELAQKNKAPLADDVGIRRAAESLSKTRHLESYLATDRLMKLISDIGEAVGSPVPIRMAEMSTPIALVASKAGKSSNQVDLQLPIETIMAVKDAILAAKMAGAQPAPTTTTAPAAPGDAE